MTITRDRWPTLLGLIGAVALLVLFGAGSQLREIGWTTGSFLGLDIAAWSLATTFLTICLIVQILLNSRATLDRERRLVDVAANLRETSAELERLAKIDPLTGVLNRRALFDRLGAEFRRSRRYGRSLTVLMIDIDHFKQVNDGYGHATGDAVLTACARQMASNIRESDEIGRYGGEEFAVILPETALADGAIVAEKLRAGIEALRVPVPDGGAAVQVTVSVGVAAIPDLATTDEQALLNRADEALYAAKNSGRDRVILADPWLPRPLQQPAG
ncbi:MAG: GGDEF domain-containing protein [Chloroflexi bacterium]|nr:GGDEF domain-containing protein [Chloroflexota bacterium]MDA1146652.1 GGDEF domain-containing protein [Chloroflexota bacterium]MQC82805.1 GGDEF domain-containing protein [Chloroflexota bacterium]PKB56597.1 MAG: hypothetical protein BZY69_00955 [SAR202 cluster bacterium Casp-Chloro-G1]